MELNKTTTTSKMKKKTNILYTTRDHKEESIFHFRKQHVFSSHILMYKVFFMSVVCNLFVYDRRNIALYERHTKKKNIDQKYVA